MILLGATPGTAVGQTIQKTDETWETCSDPEVQQPFEKYGDSRDYVLAPGGSFERLQTEVGLTTSVELDLTSLGWSSQGAQIVTGNEPFYLNKWTDGFSLSIPEGTAATSPAMCVDLHYPVFRLVSKAVGLLRDNSDAQLRVRVIYPDATDPSFKTVGTLDGSQGRHSRLGWRISPDMDLLPHRGVEEPGGRLVALRFVAASGDWRIDDIFIDPRRHR